MITNCIKYSTLFFLDFMSSEENYFVCDFEGDFRMVIGEDKSKVANIVKDNIEHFRILYSNILRDCPQVVYKPHQEKLEVEQCTFTYVYNKTYTIQKRTTTSKT